MPRLPIETKNLPGIVEDNLAALVREMDFPPLLLANLRATGHADRAFVESYFRAAPIQSRELLKLKDSINLGLGTLFPGEMPVTDDELLYAFSHELGHARGRHTLSVANMPLPRRKTAMESPVFRSNMAEREVIADVRAARALKNLGFKGMDLPLLRGLRPASIASTTGENALRIPILRKFGILLALALAAGAGLSLLKKKKKVARGTERHA